jgi:hypothetical protein
VRCPKCGHEWEWLRASLESPGVQIQKMGFVLEALSWTLADWGGGQLSSPLNPEREDLLRFLDILEKGLLSGSPGQRTGGQGPGPGTS